MATRTAVPTVESAATSDHGEFEALLDTQPARSPARPIRERIDAVLVGTLVAFGDDGATPMVVYDGQPGTAAIRARATVDLHGVHIGRRAVLIFEDGDPRLPIIAGCLRETDARPAIDMPGQVEVDADGERLIVSAKEQLVLRCGKASVTLTKAGKVLIQGTCVSNRSSGVLRLKGGSVQIN